MKVVVVSHSSADHAGAELALIELARGLAEHTDVAVHVVLPSPGPLQESLARHGTEISISPLVWWVNGPRSPVSGVRRLRQHLRAAHRLRRLLDEVRPDVVVTNTLTIPAAALAARSRHIPHVWYVHEFGVRDHGFAFDLGYERSLGLVSRLSDLVLVNSEAVRDEVARVIPARKLRVVRCAVDVPEIVAPQHGAGRSRPQIVLVGRKAPSKGQQDAVRAVAALKRRGHTPRLRLVGGGEPEDVTALESLARALGVEDLVEHLGPTHDVASHFAWADVAVTCSRAEAFGRVTVEAMKLGTPVVGARSGGTAELVRDGWNGLLYEPGDSAGLADAVERLLTEPGLATRLAATAQAWARREFSLERYADEFATVLGQVVRRPSGIAVVVPTYGSARHLGETLASLERQTVAPAEVVVVDDGSEPPTALPATTLPVRLLRIEHGGIAAARNAGVRATRAPLVHVCDHDDLVEPSFYERVLAAGGDVAHADCGFVDESGVPFPGRLGAFQWRWPLRQLVRRNPIASSAAVFRRDVFDAVGGFRDLRFVQDWDFWIRAAAAGARFAYVPDLLAWHRVHPAQQTSEARRREMLAESLAMLRGASVPAHARWSRARGVADLRLQLFRVARRPA